jgi:two-component system, OmpR family, osmolarity sensor histidine kinase EnvZ
MAFRLKDYMPRSLFGRAALILVVPVVTVQLVVSVVFIQRHFDGVTRQLSRGVMLETGVVLRAVEAAQTLEAAQAGAAGVAGGAGARGR